MNNIIRYLFTPILLLTLSIGIISCSKFESEEKQVVESQLIGNILISDLDTQLPGNIALKDSLLFLNDPFSQKGFIRIFDLGQKKEIAKIGNLESDINVFESPRISQIKDSKVIIFDNVYRKIGYVNLDSLNNHQISIKIKALEMPNNFLRYFEINDSLFVGVDYETSSPFKLVGVHKGIINEFGKYPINKKILNARKVFQGTVIYNNERNILLYATFETGYLASYEYHTDDGFKLKWENKFQEINYKTTDSLLIYPKSQFRGYHEIAFSKDYIVGLIKDKQRRYDFGRSLNNIPSTLHIRDYSGNLIKIYHLDNPVIRISSNLNSNSIYAVGASPKFSLIILKL